MGLTRRQFLQLTGTSTAGAVIFAGCSPRQGELLMQSPARLPEDLVTGLDTWYASICRLCPAGCGIIVRVMEGRAKKIEGNPDYPVNRGKLCARGQAGLQVLYHPDRIQGPLRRSGPRGSGQFEPVSWAEALDELVGKLKPLWGDYHMEQVTLISGRLRGLSAHLVWHFVRAFRGPQWIPYEPLAESALRVAISDLQKQVLMLPIPPLPLFDIANARFILSFGADFLGTWLSPVQYGVAYGQFRGRPGQRGTLIQIEPRMTATGASADQWIPIKPGTEGYLALGLAQVIIAENLTSLEAARAAGLAAIAGDPRLEAYRPQAVARITGIPERQIVDLARRFASQGPSLALGGGPAVAHTNGHFNLAAIYALNRLVGGVGQAGGILLNPPSPLASPLGETGEGGFADLPFWKMLVEAIWTGLAGPQGTDAKLVMPPQVLLVRGANPVHSLPAAYGFKEALEKVPFIASFSSFMDETTVMADLILPEHTYLEDWGSDIPEPAPGFQVMGFQQPVVNPLYDTRSFGDVLLTLAEELGPPPGRVLPWKSSRDFLREGAQALFQLRRGSIQAASFEKFWIRLLQRGGWWDEGARGPAPPLVEWGRPMEAAAPQFSGSEQDYPFHLLPFPSASLGAGSGAHLPWLQATPDPITTAVWQTWVEVNLETARRLGLGEGDVVRVESPQGSLEAPVYPHPGIHPDVVAIPMGQGHPAFGRYAQGRGANVLSLLDPSVQGSDGSLAWAATRVRLVKTGQTVRLSKAEGSVSAIEPPDEELVGVTPS